MRYFSRLFLVAAVLSVSLIVAHNISAHTNNVPGLLSNWLKTTGNPFDYNTDGLVNTLDFTIDIHPGQVHPTPTTGPSPTPGAWPQIQLTQYVTGLNNPVHITHAGDGSNRLFVVEQSGKIKIIKNNQLLSTPFLDLTSKVSCCGERGLLGLAFPPDYASKAYFFVNYTNPAGHTVIARYHTDQNPDQALPDEFIILTVNQPFANHNGGSLVFGPDGYLYIGMGDGGSQGDPNNRAQNLDDLLGKMLRINVISTQTYTIPSTNPFANGGGKPEIWSLGFRNPWKFSFDRQTGDLYIADVGQGNWEEIDFQPSTSSGGENYGWRCREGNHDFNFSGNCASLNLVSPVTEYDHSGGNCSVTGGYVYRGTSSPSLKGVYFYGDYCSGTIWGLRKSGSQWETSQLLDTSLNISSFGEDQSGNLYVANHAGAIYKLNSL